MACFRPKWASQDPLSGDVAFYDRPGDRALRLPCGHCIGCRLDYAMGWSVRCQHEASLYAENSFVTLTYDDAYLPPDSSLFYPHVQDFLKRLRFHYDRRVRFFCAAEYGHSTFRPHYHLLLFNVDFPDAYPISKRWFASDFLQRLWPLGNASLVPKINPEIAGYVSQYSLKKVYGRVDSAAWYGKCRPEFVTMSRKPGLGTDWFRKYRRDCLPRDFVVLYGGRKVRVPNFYFDLYERDDPASAAAVREARGQRVVDLPAEERTPARVAVHELVTQAGVDFFSKRGL